MDKILIIDPNNRDVERYAKFLADIGLETVCLISTKEAPSLVTNTKEKFAAVIILWEIYSSPTGPELIRLMSQRRPDLPIIVVSGTLDVTLAARAQMLGAKEFLLKPLEAKGVQNAVQRAISKNKSIPILLDKLLEKAPGKSHSYLRVLFELAKVILNQDIRILLVGESGTGKELLARAIHDLGPQKDKPWVAVSLAERSPTLIESELFGHEKGAFTGANIQRKGCLEEASDGILFLDEIGDLDETLQVKLLRVIQEKTFRRLGGSKDIKFEARLITATNHDLSSDISCGKFRSDLYHRIAEYEVYIPPLRVRKGDIELLIDVFLERMDSDKKRKISRETLFILSSYHFPGNIRELENIIKRFLVVVPEGIILPSHLPLDVMDKMSQISEILNETGKFELPEEWMKLTYDEAIKKLILSFNKEYLSQKMRESGGRIGKAADLAGMNRKTFRIHLKECGIEDIPSNKD